MYVFAVSAYTCVMEIVVPMKGGWGGVGENGDSVCYIINNNLYTAKAGSTMLVFSVPSWFIG